MSVQVCSSVGDEVNEMASRVDRSTVHSSRADILLAIENISLTKRIIS